MNVADPAPADPAPTRGASRPFGPRALIGRSIDLIGPAAFPAAYFATRNFETATWATTVGAAVALLLRYAFDRHLALISVASGIVAFATGLLTLAFGNDVILESKPTLVNCVLGVGFVVAWLLGGRPAKALFGGAINVPDRVWATLCLRAGLYAFAMALANEIIRRTASTSAWALFHFPGQLLLHAAFVAAQVPLILSARRKEAAPRPTSDDAD